MKDDDNGKMLGGAGSGITGRMLGVARQGADQMLGGARQSADQMLGGARLGANRMLAVGANRYASREIGGIKSHGEGDVGAQSAGCQDAVLRSMVVESINALREEVANLRLEVGQIKKLGASVSVHHARGKLCTLYVRVPESGSEVSHIGKARLESLLGCEVPQYVCIKQFPPSFKVKILESNLASGYRFRKK